MDRDVTYVTGECVENISTSCEPLESFLKILWFFSTRDIFYSNPRPLIRFWVIIHPPWLFHPPPSIYIYIYIYIYFYFSSFWRYTEVSNYDFQTGIGTGADFLYFANLVWKPTMGYAGELLFLPSTVNPGGEKTIFLAFFGPSIRNLSQTDCLKNIGNLKTPLTGISFPRWHFIYIASATYI